MLTKNARVVHFLEYDNYYEVHLEWDVEEFPPGVSNMGTYFDDEAPRQCVQTKLIALCKKTRK